MAMVDVDDVVVDDDDDDVDDGDDDSLLSSRFDQSLCSRTIAIVARRRWLAWHEGDSAKGRRSAFSFSCSIIILIIIIIVVVVVVVVVVVIVIVVYLFYSILSPKASSRGVPNNLIQRLASAKRAGVAWRTVVAI
jgi:hypothetical protein